MARQMGIIPLKGTIGNITFYKSKAGHLAREKGGVEAARIATDPAFIRTRENGAEFGRAGKASRLLRTSLRTLLLQIRDSYIASRLSSAMVKVIQADATNARGERNVIDGEAELLKGFEFNGNSPLTSTLYAPFTPAIDRAAGVLKVDVPAFVPGSMVAAPPGATHLKMYVAGVEIDFEGGTFINGIAASGELPIDETLTAPINLAVNVTANSAKPLFLALGIAFYQRVNGKMYDLKNGAYNALALVDISGAPATPNP
ncbi:MAG TPA: hypothetical protein VM802_29440 [Chitinophaga sp.]|uniref:hypothetical protein n=1 Tax=Chitinophaga sp. TaxID=1869181 RepID=UPI002BD9B78C|nr:hypothetical protein [Chitinophaga sp.]HVI49026.1 hypothetical protein [Chitinophaga sp.]